MYGKIFATMYDGSIYGKWQAIVTFQQMIALADKEGVVDMTAAALSARTSIPLEIIEKGISDLESPDSMSRTPDEDGRRIVLLDEHRPWGWKITNYQKYREIRTAEERREYHRKYWHKRKLNKTQQTQPIVEAEVKAEVKHTPKTTKRKTGLPEDFGVSDRVRKWAKEKGHNNLEAHLENFISQSQAKGYQYVDWDAALMNAIRNDWARIGNSEDQFAGVI